MANKVHFLLQRVVKAGAISGFACYRLPGLFLLLLVALPACEQKQIQEQAITGPTFAEPVAVAAGKPVVTRLDTVAPAQVIRVPSKATTYSHKTATGITNRQLLPSVVKPAGFQVHMQSYNTEDGLGISSVICSFKDKRGNLWFGTQGGGVSRYDGITFATYTTAQGLAGNAIRSIGQGKDGSMWFGTYGNGVSRYDGTTFTTFTTEQGLAGNAVWSIGQANDGSMWFGTSNGASRYQNGTFTTYSTEQGLAGNTVRAITQASDNSLWFGTNRGVSRYSGTTFTTYTSAHGLAGNSVSCLAEASDGSIWIGTGSGATRYKGTDFTTYTTEQGLAENNIRAILQHQDGSLWFGTNSSGVSRYNGATFTTFTTAQGLAGNAVATISQAGDGSLWFGTKGGGVSRYDGTGFTAYTTELGLTGNKVFGIAQARDGSLWFGTDEKGVSRYDGTTFTTFTTAQGLAGNGVMSIAQARDGSMWFGTFSGVSRYDGTTFTSYTTANGLAGNEVWTLFQAQDGSMWFGTNDKGVTRFDGTTFTTFTTAQGLAGNSVLCIAQDRNGSMWFGTNGGGVSRYNGNSFTTFTTDHGLAGNTVYSITKDHSENLWIGTNGGGVSRYDGSSFLTFNTSQGLPDNVVYASAQRERTLFFGTNKGIAGLSFKARNSSAPAALPAVNNLSNNKLQQHYKPVWEVFNTATGYPVKDLNLNALFCDSNGILWAGTGDDKTALVRFDYLATRKETAPPSLLIRNLKLNEQNIAWHTLLPASAATDSATLAQQQVHAYGRTLTAAETDSLKQAFSSIRLKDVSSHYPLPQDLVLPYRHNHVTFEFGALELVRPQLVNYQYKLEGYDRDWSPVLKKTTATFGHIHEGSYTFKLRAQSPAGVWSEPILYSFQVLPPWYRTWWAYLAYVMVAVTGLWLFVRWRERNLQQEKDVLERKVSVRTEQLQKRTVELSAEKERSEELLLNILPAETAEELKQFGKAKARFHRQVTVLFCDIKDFTLIAEELPAEQLVSFLDEYFRLFDHIVEKQGLEKIKTIGDAYLCAGGLRKDDTITPQDVVRAALQILNVVEELKIQRMQLGLPWFEVRIGIHTGPVVAGVVGIKKFAFDIWGDTVNTAARIEQCSEPGRINISSATYQLISGQFACTPRGLIDAKNKGQIKMYFVEAEVPSEVKLLETQ